MQPEKKFVKITVFEFAWEHLMTNHHKPHFCTLSSDISYTGFFGTQNGSFNILNVYFNVFVNGIT